MARPVPTIGVTLRFPVDLHGRLLDKRSATGETTQAFVLRLIEAALPRQSRPKRRKAAG